MLARTMKKRKMVVTEIEKRNKGFTTCSLKISTSPFHSEKVTLLSIVNDCMTTKNLLLHLDYVFPIKKNTLHPPLASITHQRHSSLSSPRVPYRYQVYSTSLRKNRRAGTECEGCTVKVDNRFICHCVRDIKCGRDGTGLFYNKCTEEKKNMQRGRRERGVSLEIFCVTNCGTLHTEMQAATIMYLFHIKIVCWCTVYT